MKKIVAVAAGLSLTFAVSSLAVAEEEAAIKEECRAIAEQHGVTGEKMDEWIDRCLENTRRLQREREAERQRGDSGAETEQGQDAPAH